MIYRVVVYCTALSILVGCGAEMPEQNEPKIRYVTNKAIAGVSMGGGAAAQIGLSQPERWGLRRYLRHSWTFKALLV